MVDRDDELAHTATAAGPRGDVAAALGDHLGRYRLERKLGEGGMGVVHAAFDPDLERRVALKVLRRIDAGDEARQRLLREARAMARVTHANVVTVHEVDTCDDRDYVAMELIDGESVAEWLRSGKRTTEEILAAFLAAGRGLAAAHAAGLVHRDFKPHNVLRGRDGRVVVTDFGLARGVDNTVAISLETTLPVGTPVEATPSSLSGLTATGSVLGTPAYMAPEQWSGGSVGPTADQFAFCVALWEALTGARPFTGQTIDELKAQVKRGPAELDASKLPRRMRAALRRGLDPDPGARWPNMGALLAAIGRGPRRMSLAVASGVAVVIAGGIAVVALGGGSGRAACARPVLEPGSVWSPGIATAVPSQLVGVFGAGVESWKKARVKACAADERVRSTQLRCLDGVLARLDVIRRSFPRVSGLDEEDVRANLIDPSVCFMAEPPRLATVDSPELVTAWTFLAKTEVEGAHPPVKDARAFADCPGLEPCAHTIALHALAKTTSDVPVKRAALSEAVSTAEQCQDDRVMADVQIESLPYEIEQPRIGPKGQAAIKRMQAAVDRIPSAILVASVDHWKANIALQQEHWQDAFTHEEATVDALERAGLRRHAVIAALEAIELRFARREAADLEADRTMVAHWLPIARTLHPGGLATSLEREDALARYFQGDVEAAHADLVRLWTKPEPRDGVQRIEGDVVDREGHTVARATVTVSHFVNADSVGAPLPLDGFRSVDTSLRWVVTDATGHSTIPDGPTYGAIEAQLGSQRSTVAPIGDHVKLVLQPTRRLSGKVVLGSAANTQLFVVVKDSAKGAEFSQVLGTVAADGSFSIDGVPTGRVRIGVAREYQLSGRQLEFKPIEASSGSLGGIELGLKSTSRTLDVIARSPLSTPLENAQVVILPGRVHVANVGALNASINSGATTQFAHHVVGEQVPGDALGRLQAGDLIAHFTDVPAGDVTVCALGLPGDVLDPKQQRVISEHLAQLEVRCEPVSGDAKIVVVMAPPQKRFD